MNTYRLTTDLRHGGLGLRRVWCSYITPWITLVQQEMQNNTPTRHLTTTHYKYIEAVRALGGTVGHCISQPRQARPHAEGLFDSQSS